MEVYETLFEGKNQDKGETNTSRNKENEIDLTGDMLPKDRIHIRWALLR